MVPHGGPVTRDPALITGATAGIGREFARQLAARGHALVLVARDGARLNDAAQVLRAEGAPHVEVLSADLSTDAGTDAACARLRRGDVGILVNNAGFGTKGTLARTDAEAQDRMVRLHVVAPNRLTQAALAGMLERGRGAVINVSSVASYLHSVGNVNYSATKAYLRSFSESLALEMEPKGVHVQALCPGFTHTEFHARGAMNMSHTPRWLWLTAERVVRESLAGMDRGAPVVLVPGRRYRVLLAMHRLIPAGLRRLLVGRYRRP